LAWPRDLVRAPQIDIVGAQAAVPWRERSTNCNLSHTEGGENTAGLESETTRLSNERLDGRWVNRLGTAERKRERGEVEILHAFESAGCEHP